MESFTCGFVQANLRCNGIVSPSKIALADSVWIELIRPLQLQRFRFARKIVLLNIFQIFPSTDST
jgi:hypothetical protein